MKTKLTKNSGQIKPDFTLAHSEIFIEVAFFNDDVERVLIDTQDEDSDGYAGRWTRAAALAFLFVNANQLQRESICDALNNARATFVVVECNQSCRAGKSTNTYVRRWKI